MADKKSAQALTHGQRNKIWSAEPAEWAATLGAMFPNTRFKLAGQGSDAKITCNCVLPTHADSNASAVFHLGRGFYRCLGGSCNAYYADPVRLLAAAKQKGYQQSFQFLTGALNMSMPAKLRAQLARHEQYQKILTELHRVTSYVLIQAANNPTDPAYAVYQDAVQYLVARGFTVTDVAMLGVGVFPLKRHLFDHASKDLRDHIYSLFDRGVFPPQPTARGPYTGHLTFDYETTPGVHANVKMRCVTPGPAFKHETWWGYGDSTGLFGLSAFKHLYGNPNIDWNLHIVEGEFDALAAITHQGSVRDYPFVSASGGGLPDLEAVAPLGADHVVIVGDDDLGGVSFVRNALSHGGDADVVLRVYKYDASFAPGSDPYDLVLGHGGAHAAAFFRSLSAQTSVLEPHDWAAQQVTNEWTAHPSMPVNELAALVKQYARAVTLNEGRDVFVDRVHSITGMRRRAIQAYMVGEITNGRTFNLAIEHQLLVDIEPLVNRGGSLLCYSKGSRTTFDLPLIKRDPCILALNRHVFRDIGAASWLEARVGMPTFLTHREDRKGRKVEVPWTLQSSNLRSHIHEVVAENLVSQTPVEGCIQVYKQGVHALMPTSGSSAGPNHRHVYVLNGDHLFHTEVFGDGELAAWEACSSPKVHDDAVFLVGDERPWSENLNSIGDLRNTIPMEQGIELHDELVSLLSASWNFGAGDVAAEFLASVLPTFIIHQLSGYCPMMHFTGKTQAGKSSLTKGLIRGDDFNGAIHLVEHVQGFDDYSVAGLIMSAEGDARLLAMDEFEDSDDTRKSKRKSVVNDIYEAARNIPTGMNLTRGLPDGGTREHYVRTGMITSGIHPIRREVDANRYFTVELLRVTDSIPPMVRMMSRVSPEQIAGMRRQMTLFCLQHVGALWQAYHEVKVELTTPGVLDIKEYRFLQMIQLMAAFRKMIGLEYVQMVQELINLHERTLATSVMSEEEQLFRAVVETPAILIDPEAREHRSLQDIVNSESLLENLSDTDCGIYYAQGTNFLVLYPTKIVGAILRRSNVYRSVENPHSILNRLKPHRLVTYDPDMLRKNRQVMRHLNKYITAPQPDELLIINLSALRVAASDDLPKITLATNNVTM